MASNVTPIRPTSPPHNIEAEQALLGAILINNEAYHRVAGFLAAEHFFESVHARVFAVMRRAIDAGQLADPILLKLAFDDDPDLRDFNGSEYLSRMARSAETILNAEDYGREIYSLWRRRQVLAYVDDLKSKAADPLSEGFEETLRGFQQQVPVELDRKIEPLVFISRERLLTEPPTREFVLEEFIPRRAVSSLYGSGGTGKSFIAQLLATCVATSNNFLGLNVMQGPVLGLFAEDDEDELHRRQTVFDRYFGIKTPADFGGLHLLSLDQVSNALFAHWEAGEPKWTEEFERLEATVALLTPMLLILDNIAQLYAANENDRQAVTMFLNGLRRLARQYNMAVLLLGHPSASKEYSGNTAWEAGVRSRLSFVRKDKDDAEDDNEPDRYTLALKKTNYAKVREIQLVVDRGSGIVRPDTPEGESPVAAMERRNRENSEVEAICRAVEELWARGFTCNANRRTPDSYLPKLMQQYGMLNGMSVRAAELATDRAIAQGTLSMREGFAWYANRNPKKVLATHSMQARAAK